MGQDNTKLQKIREYARTAVLEKEDNLKEESKKTVSSDIDTKNLNLFSRNILKSKSVEKFQKPEEIVSQNYVAPKFNINTINDKQIKNEANIVEVVKSEQKNDVIIEEKAQEINKDDKEDVEEKVETLYNSSLNIEQTGEEIIDKELNTYSKKSNNYKFRFNLLTSVFCCLIAILGGWVIGNAIEIASTNSQIVSEIGKGEEYQVNIIEYLSKIGKLDDNVSQSPPNPEDGSLFPIEEIIPITPQPLEDTTAYEQESNWFDKICNWLKNLFGG